MTWGEILQLAVGALVTGDIAATMALKKRLTRIEESQAASNAMMAEALKAQAEHTRAQAQQEARLALGNQAFAQMREDLLELRSRVHALEGKR